MVPTSSSELWSSLQKDARAEKKQLTLAEKAEARAEEVPQTPNLFGNMHKLIDFTHVMSLTLVELSENGVMQNNGSPSFEDVRTGEEEVCRLHLHHSNNSTKNREAFNMHMDHHIIEQDPTVAFNMYSMHFNKGAAASIVHYYTVLQLINSFSINKHYNIQKKVLYTLIKTLG